MKHCCMSLIAVTTIPAMTPPVPMAIGKVRVSSSRGMAKKAVMIGAVAASPLVRVGPISLTPATAKLIDKAGRNNQTSANRRAASVNQ